MTNNALAVADQLEIQALIARYALLMDKGDPAWGDLFVENEASELSGISPQPVRGIDNLRRIPVAAYQRHQGKAFHHVTNLLIEPGDHDGAAKVQAYALVSDWQDGGKLTLLARYAMSLLRTPAGWRLSKVNLSVVR